MSKKLNSLLCKPDPNASIFSGNLTGDHLVYLKFVLSPDKVITLDLKNVLPGKACWVAADAAVLLEAGSFFSSIWLDQVFVSQNLIHTIEDYLVSWVQNLIGLARKAGKVQFGYEKVKKLTQAKKSGMVISASDAGCTLKACHPFSSLLTGQELGKIFGRDRVVHLSIEQGCPLIDTLNCALLCLAGFRKKEGISVFL